MVIECFEEDIIVKVAMHLISSKTFKNKNDNNRLNDYEEIV